MTEAFKTRHRSAPTVHSRGRCGSGDTYRRITRDGRKIDVLDRGDLLVMAEIYRRYGSGEPMGRIGKDLYARKVNSSSRRLRVNPGSVAWFEQKRVVSAAPAA